MTATLTRPRPNNRNQRADVDQQRLAEVHHRKLAYIPNSSFKATDDQIDWLDQPQLKAVELGDSVQRVPKVNGLPAHLMRMCETPIMSAEEERAFFRRMNYLKFRHNALCARARKGRATQEMLAEIEDLAERADRIRNYIIQANTRLVMSIAKKFSDSSNTFDDMLSEGIASLMHAVEKFDYDRGFRFSTYATTSIQRDLYRLVLKNQKQLSRFSTGSEEVFATCPGDHAAEAQRDVSAESTYGSLTEMLEQLDPREKLIIRHRFGFDTEGGRKATYTRLGKRLGISKERVRQLAERAIAKLRGIAPEFGLAGLEA